jgi:hypothetical protein
MKRGEDTRYCRRKRRSVCRRGFTLTEKSSKVAAAADATSAFIATSNAKELPMEIKAEARDVEAAGASVTVLGMRLARIKDLGLR